ETKRSFFFCRRLRGKSPWILRGLLIRRKENWSAPAILLLRRPLKPLPTEIWSIAIRKWPDIIRYGLRSMLPEAALITAITARWYSILAIGCAPEHRKT